MQPWIPASSPTLTRNVTDFVATGITRPLCPHSHLIPTTKRSVRRRCRITAMDGKVKDMTLDSQHAASLRSPCKLQIYRLSPRRDYWTASEGAIILDGEFETVNPAECEMRYPAVPMASTTPPASYTAKPQLGTRFPTEIKHPSYNQTSAFFAELQHPTQENSSLISKKLRCRYSPQEPTVNLHHRFRFAVNNRQQALQGHGQTQCLNL